MALAPALNCSRRAAESGGPLGRALRPVYVVLRSSTTGTTFERIGSGSAHVIAHHKAKQAGAAVPLAAGIGAQRVESLLGLRGRAATAGGTRRLCPGAAAWARVTMREREWLSVSQEDDTRSSSILSRFGFPLLHGPSSPRGSGSVGAKLSFVSLDHHLPAGDIRDSGGALAISPHR